MAQGKFSQPRTNKHRDDDIPVRKAVRKTVAADPIEKAEADIAKFMDTAMRESAAPQLGDTQKITGLDQIKPEWKDATQVAPEGWTDLNQLPENWQDATQVVPQTATSPIPEVQPRPVVQNRTIPQSAPLTEEDEEEYEEAPTFFQQYRKPILVGGCAAILLLLGLIIGLVVSMNNKDVDDGKILDNVIAAGVDIGGMTPEDAKVAVYNATAATYSVKTMTVTLPDTILEFTPADTGVTLDVDALVEAAYHYGRTGTDAEIEKAKAQVLVGQYVMDLMPYLELDAEYIHETLTAYSESFNSSYLSSSYTFEGTKPGLTAEKFDETNPCQTLVLSIGTPGRNLDIEAVYTSVLEAYSSNVFEVDASEAPEEMPELPDLDAIFEEYCSTPVDAYMDMQSFEVTGEIYGYTFDLDAAKALLADAEYGSTIRIEMEYIIPDTPSADLVGSLYADVLGSCETPHTSNANRNTNLRLACQAINGLVLEPGDEFSFNDVVGQRTSERGYRSAPAYSNGETVDELGGGVCQVSSTLYYAVLLADLEVTARTNHSYVSSYIEKGMDATVSWGGPEFKFRNNTSYPIRIEAEVADGYVKIRLLGTDEKDYYIEMSYDIAGYLDEETEYKEFEYDNKEGYKDGDVIQEGSDGMVVDTYKNKYDKETGEKLREEYVTRSSYRPHNKIIAKVAPAPTTEAPTEVTEAPTVETEVPTENVSPDVPDVNDPES